MVGELPPWFKFRAASVFSSPSYQAALRDGDLARALLALMSWNWTQGCLKTERVKLGMMLGVGETVMAQLEVHGVVRAVGDGLVEASLDWLMDARDEAFAYRGEQSARGKASGKARASTGDTAHVPERTAVLPRLNRGSTKREEESREEQRTSSTRGRVSSSVPADSLFDGAGEQGTGPRRRSLKRRSAAESWERVLGRPQYASLRNDALFICAWREWIDWCGASEAAAEPPIGAQATRMFNRAMSDPARYARAIQLSIERNYKGVDPDWLQEPRAPQGSTGVPKGEAAAVRAIAMGREVLGRLEGKG